MPTLKQLCENTVPVVLTRGQLSITAQALIERISWSNPRYVELQTVAGAVQDERSSLVTAYSIERQGYLATRAELSDADFQEAQLQTTAPKKKSDMVAPLDIAERTAKLQEQLTRADEELRAHAGAFTAKLEALDTRIFANLCERASFLIASWDLAGDDEKTALATDAATLEATFMDKQNVLAQLVVACEAATFGPLVTPTDSTP